MPSLQAPSPLRRRERRQGATDAAWFGPFRRSPPVRAASPGDGPPAPRAQLTPEPDGAHAGSALGFSCQLNCGAVREAGEDGAEPDAGLAGADDQCVSSSSSEQEGTAEVILDQNGTGRKPHVQHRTAKDRNRGLHQIRSWLCRHDCGAGVPDEAFAQGLVQGLSGAWGGQAPEAATGAQVHLGDEAGCRGLLPRARKEPRRDHAQDGLSRQQGVPLRLDRRACPRAEEIRGGRARKRVLSRSRRRCRRWPSPGPAAEPLRRSPRSTACRGRRPTSSEGR